MFVCDPKINRSGLVSSINYVRMNCNKYVLTIENIYLYKK